MAFLTPEEAGITGKYNSQKITLDNFLTELKAPRESFGQEDPANARPRPENMPGTMEPDATFEPPNLPGTGDAINPRDEEASRRQAKYTAKFVVSTIDTGIGNGCKFIAKAKSPKPYQATPDEKSDMEEVWTEYLKEVGGDIPPGIMVLLITSVVYTPKLIQAFSDKKLAQQVDSQADEIKRLKDEINALKDKK